MVRKLEQNAYLVRHMVQHGHCDLLHVAPGCLVGACELYHNHGVSQIGVCWIGYMSETRRSEFQGMLMDWAMDTVVGLVRDMVLIVGD